MTAEIVDEEGEEVDGEEGGGAGMEALPEWQHHCWGRRNLVGALAFVLPLATVTEDRRKSMLFWSF